MRAGPAVAPRHRVADGEGVADSVAATTSGAGGTGLGRARIGVAGTVSGDAGGHEVSTSRRDAGVHLAMDRRVPAEAGAYVASRHEDERILGRKGRNGPLSPAHAHLARHGNTGGNTFPNS